MALSIITAVHNQLAVNRIFLDSLQRYTRLPFELIVVDNQSTDGSAEFFEANGVKVIRNDGNYSYPHCQNQGMDAARYDLFAFLNNDIIVSPGWDKHLLEAMDRNQLEVATCCGVERLEDRRVTRFYRKKWSLIRNVIGAFGSGERSLRLMHRCMYGNWQRFAEQRWAKFGCAIREGYVGNSVMMKRSALEKIGRWDERIQAGDCDLYLRVKKRHLEKGDIQPVQVCLGVFNHHFIRMTVRSARPEFKDRANLIPWREKWGDDKIAEHIGNLD